MNLVLASGGERPLTAPVVIGREPVRDGHEPIRLDDPGRSASRSHAAIRPLGSALIEVTDLGTVNGTTVRFDGTPVALRPNEPTVVTVPCRVSCGNGPEITVV